MCIRDRLNKQVMLSPEFLELWSKIKQKTAYRVSIDTEQLVKNLSLIHISFHAYYKARLLEQLPEAEQFIPVFASSDIEIYPFRCV